MIHNKNNSSNGKVFEQFYYIDDKKLHDLAEVQEEYEKHNGDKSKYVGKMLCPECKKAVLSFTRRTSTRRAYLSKYPSSSHDVKCSYIHEYSPKKVFVEYVKNLGNEQIDSKLESVLNSLFNSKSAKKDQNLADQDKENPFLITNIKNGRKTQKQYCVPRKSLNTNIDPEDNGKSYLFYGRVKLRSVDTSKDGIYNLHILTLQKGEWKYKIRVYRETIKDDFDEDKVYEVALYGTIDCKYGMSSQIKMVDQRGIKVREVSISDK